MRKVKVRVADCNLDKRGVRTKSQTVLERPVHKCVLLHESTRQTEGFHRRRSIEICTTVRMCSEIVTPSIVIYVNINDPVKRNVFVAIVPVAKRRSL